MYTALLQVIIYQLAKYEKDPIKNGREIAERRKLERNKIIKKEIRKKRQYNNRMVFRLCRQTLIAFPSHSFIFVAILNTHCFFFSASIPSNLISMLQVLFFTHWYSVAAVCRNAVSASCFWWHDKLSYVTVDCTDSMEGLFTPVKET